MDLYICISSVLYIDPLETPQPPTSPGFYVSQSLSSRRDSFQKVKSNRARACPPPRPPPSPAAVPPLWGKAARAAHHVSPSVLGGASQQGQRRELRVDSTDERSCSVIRNVSGPTCQGDALTLAKSGRGSGCPGPAMGPGWVNQVGHRGDWRL